MTIDHARQIIEQWRIEYNTERPHSSLGDLTPEEFVQNPDLLPPYGRETALRVKTLTKSGKKQIINYGL
jgi:hypothetical protein